MALNRLEKHIYRGGLICRNCYPPPVYRSIKNVAVGSDDYITHRMVKLAQKEGIPLKRYSLDTIHSVLSGKNQLLYALTPHDMKCNFYDGDVGCCGFNRADRERTIECSAIC